MLAVASEYVVETAFVDRAMPFEVSPELVTFPHGSPGSAEPTVPVDAGAFRDSLLAVQQGLEPIERLRIHEKRSVMQDDVDRLNAGDFAVGESPLVLNHSINVVPRGDRELDGLAIKVGPKSRVGFIHQGLIGVVLLLKLCFFHRWEVPTMADASGMPLGG